MAEGPTTGLDEVFSDGPGVLPKRRGRPPELKKTQEMLAVCRETLARQQEEIENLKDEQTKREQEVTELRRRSSSTTGVKESELLRSLDDQCFQQREELRRLRQQYDALSNQPRIETRFPKISVSKFSGTEDLDDYLVQFEAVSQLQKWSDAEKHVLLLSKLEGSALSAVNTAKTKTYTEMVVCLKENFSPEQRELSLQKLQSRQQKKGENFSILAADIQRLAMKAYPTVDDRTRDVIATDHFVNSVQNSVIRQKLREKHPVNLSSAIREARQILADQETETMLVRRSERVHTIEDSEIEKLREQVCQLQMNLNEMKPKTSDSSHGDETKKNHSPLDDKQTRVRRKGPPTCFHCKYKGHVKKWCPFLMGNKDESAPIQPTTEPSTLKKTQENFRG